MAKKLSITTKVAVIFYLLILVGFLSTSSSLAWTPGEPLVPCGAPGQPECTQCELLHLVKNVIDFVMIAASPILATLFFIIAGVYIMLGGANPGMLSTGKSIFKSTFIGITIVMLAWLITNTLIQTLADTSKVGSGGNWFQLSCSDIGLSTTPPGTGNPNPPPPPPPPSGCTATVCVSGESATPTSDGAVITWTTNIPATSQVHHGAGAQMLAYTPIDNNLTTSHSVTLSGYPLNTLVRYQVISTGSGYTATGGIFNFTTLNTSGNAVTISDVYASNITDNSVDIYWYTDVPSTSQVNYGTLTSYGSSTALDNNLTNDHNVTISGLQANTTYHFQVVSSITGYTARSSDYTFITAGGVSGTVTISGVASVNITSNSATITWITDVPSTSQIEYGTTISYGSTTATDSNMVIDHSIVITGLSSGTAYNFKAISSISGYTARSSNSTFTTTIVSGPTVTISNVTSSNITSSGVTIAWTTDVPSTSQVEYGTTTSYGQVTPLNSTQTTNHSVTISGLTANTTYNFRTVSSITGYTARSSNYTFITGGGGGGTVTISSVASSNITANSATITWTTDVPSTSQIEFGTTTSYGSTTTADSNPATSHTVIISGLNSGTTYNFRAISSISGYTARSSNSTFTTTIVSGPTVTISNVTSSNITSSGVTITWTTDVPSTSQVEYISTTYGLATTPIDNTLVTSHTVTITGLQGETYNYRAISTITGYTARSSQFTFIIISQCTNIAGTGPIRIALIATNWLSDATGYYCSLEWTSSDMSSLWISTVNQYRELLTRFPPYNTSNFSLWRAETIDQITPNNVCSSVSIPVRVSKCADSNFRSWTRLGTRTVDLARDAGVTILAHEMAHAFARLADEYEETGVPPNPSDDNTNCKFNGYPGGLSVRYEGCSYQGTGSNWWRDAPADLMYRARQSYNQFGPVDTIIIQSYIDNYKP